MLLLVLVSRAEIIRSQAIGRTEMPFGGIVSYYEFISSPEVNVSLLTAAGPAQAWRFKEGLMVTANDTVQIYSRLTGGRTSAFAVSSRYQSGRIHEKPWFLYFEITGHQLLLTGYGSALPDTVQLTPSETLALPLDVGTGWMSSPFADIKDSPDHFSLPFLSQNDTLIADASGSLTLLNDSYYAIRLQILSGYQQKEDSSGERISRIGYRWISPHIGTVLEIWSYPGETDLHFNEAETVYRLLSTNVQEFGCDPTCDPDYNVPPEFDLSQNYPNPFNQTTHIRIAVPFASDLKFQIYNTLGAAIYSLEEDVLPGFHELTWSGENQNGLPVASGFYIYRLWLTAVNGSSSIYETKQMILLR